MSAEANVAEKFAAIVKKQRPAIESQLGAALTDINRNPQAMDLILYHFGWKNENLQPERNDVFPGKGIRPVLAGMTAEALGLDPKKVAPLGAGLEMIHNFTLIHDDIQDGDSVRHNRRTVHAVFGEALGINAGNELHALGYKQIMNLIDSGFSPNQVLQIYDKVFETVTRIAEGQDMDIRFEKQQIVTINEYLRMIKGKTGVMIDASILLAAELAGADNETMNSLKTYADALGKLFQISDDKLGIWGNTKETGKPDDGDIKKHKKTYPVLYALENARKAEDSPEKDLLLSYYSGTAQATEEQVNKIRAALEFFGAKEATENFIREYREIAINAINNSPIPEDKRDNFITMAMFFADRDH